MSSDALEFAKELGPLTYFLVVAIILLCLALIYQTKELSKANKTIIDLSREMVQTSTSNKALLTQITGLLNTLVGRASHG